MKKIAFFVVIAAVAAGGAAAVFLLTRNPGVPLRFVYTGRTRGYLVRLEETHGGRWLGGFARRGTVIKQAASPTTFVVDVGGFVAGRKLDTTAYKKVLSKYVLKGMEQTGVEIANVGIIDQALGRERLARYVSEASFPFVSASLTDPETDEYVFEPFVVIEKGGVRVAFVGIL
ncbi:MAG: hypothetical protein J7M19_05490, partial [Planctomycetes bacterium]|nr:hypothetical protein [Planctomycetota bacterium]